MKTAEWITASLLAVAATGVAVAIMARPAVSPMADASEGSTDVVADRSAPQQTDLVAKLASMEGDLRALSEEVAILRSEVDRLRRHGGQQADEAVVRGENDLEERVSGILEKRQQEVLDREISDRKGIDVRALDEFSEHVALSTRDRAALEKAFFDATERHVNLVNEGKQGDLPWEDVREELSTSHQVGSETVAKILGDADYATLATIAAKHGSSLQLLAPAESPGPLYLADQDAPTRAQP